MLDHSRDDLVQRKGGISPDPVHVPDSLLERWRVNLAVEKLFTLIEQVRVKVRRRIGTLFQNGSGRVGETELLGHRIDGLVASGICRQARGEIFERLQSRIQDLSGRLSASVTDNFSRI